MLKDDIERMVEQSSRRLLQVSSPPVKYWLMIQVMGKDEEDTVLQLTMQDMEKYRPKQKLLERLNRDGTWSIPKQRKVAEDAGRGPPFGYTYIAMLRNLYSLLQYKTGRNEGHVNAALERILSWQTEEGYVPGPWTYEVPLPHYNGFALHDLLRFGLGSDRRVRRLIDWLLSIQRADGGWSIPYLMDVFYLPEHRGRKSREFFDFIRNADKSQFDLRQFDRIPSCIWSTMQVVWGMVESPALSKTEEIRKGADFFLDRFFKKNYHASFYHTEKVWTRLKYPLNFGSGLVALDILTRLGYGPSDRRMEKPIRWLLSERATDGFWNQSMRPNADSDQWITLIALRILSRYSKLM